MRAGQWDIMRRTLGWVTLKKFMFCIIFALVIFQLWYLVHCRSVGAKGYRGLQILADHLTLSQPGEKIMPTIYFITPPPIFRPSYGPTLCDASSIANAYFPPRSRDMAGAPVDVGTWGRAHTNFVSHLNPIPTRGDRLCPPYTDVPTKFWKSQERLYGYGFFRHCDRRPMSVVIQPYNAAE